MIFSCLGTPDSINYRSCLFKCTQLVVLAASQILYLKKKKLSIIYLEFWHFAVLLLPSVICNVSVPVRLSFLFRLSQLATACDKNTLLRQQLFFLCFTQLRQQI